MTARLLPKTESELSNAVEVLDPNSWPQEVAVELEHGEVELRLLCDRFLVPVSEVKHEFMNFVFCLTVICQCINKNNNV